MPREVNKLFPQIAEGVPPDTSDPDGATPLMLAAAGAKRGSELDDSPELAEAD